MRSIVFLVFGIAVLAGLFVVMKPDSTPALPPQTHTWHWKIEDGLPVQTPPDLTATEGDTAILRFSSNQPDALHVHGYDRDLDIPAGETVELRLELEHAGRFPLELHLSYTALGDMLVQPR